MSAGRYVRLVKGSIIVQRHDLQGVIAHLHDLARHLEHLIPNETAYDDAALLRSRDFAGGFAQRAAYEKEVAAAVLEALAERPANAAYEPIAIEGYSTEQTESAVLRLWKAGMLDAHSTKPKQVVPGALTTKGYRALQRAVKHVCV